MKKRVLNKKTEIKNAVEPKKTESENIVSKIVPLQLSRFNKDLNDFKFAVECFEDVNFSTRDGLIELFNMAILDGHLYAVYESLKSKTMQRPYKLTNPDGTTNIEKTNLLKSVWFQKTISYALDSVFYGHSLIQFGDRVGFDFKSVKIVPREYVDPVKKEVRKVPTANGGTSYISDPFDKWLVEIGEPDSMGLFSKTIPLIIYKKNALNCWAEYSELFGAPMRIGKTNIRDAKVRDNMYKMLENMGSSAFGVFNMDDKIEIIGDSKSDAFNVFDKMIDRTNSEISKIILSSTMTVDNGSSRSQSEIHAETTGARERMNEKMLEFWVNDVLIPFLIQKHSFPLQNLRFSFEYVENVSSDTQFDRELKLLNYFDIPENHFIEKYGVPVQKKSAPVGGTPAKKQ